MNNQKTKHKQLADLYVPYSNCQLCPLAVLGRTNVVFGSGNPNAKLLIIGEAPGQNENQQGLPFVGRSGILLDKIFQTIGFKREEIYITNVVKCLPPNNRQPKPIEISQCKKILLEKQIHIIAPQVICTLGAVAANALLENTHSLSTLRGKLQHYNSIPVLVTYHPAYILRKPTAFTFLLQDIEKAYKLTLK